MSWLTWLETVAGESVVSFVPCDSYAPSRCENPDEHPRYIPQIPIGQLLQAVITLNGEIAEKVSSSFGIPICDCWLNCSRSIPQCRGWTNCARRDAFDMTMILAIWCISMVYLPTVTVYEIVHINKHDGVLTTTQYPPSLCTSLTYSRILRELRTAG
jgi:hypothetical protein